jgi:tetratricopeptide (TPR) repeat protein
MRKHSIDPGIHHQIRTLLPDLAAAANNASLGLAESGRLDEALNLMREAVSHSRRLAATDPSLLPDLAICLNNLSNRLAEVGQPEEALTRAEEATNLYRKLAIADPESFLPDLALSLNSLSVRLAEVGRPEEGLGPIQAAVAIRRALVLADGSAEALGKGHRAEIVDLLAEGTDSLPNLAASLNSLSVRLAGGKKPVLPSRRRSATTALLPERAERHSSPTCPFLSTTSPGSSPRLASRRRPSWWLERRPCSALPMSGCRTPGQPPRGDPIRRPRLRRRRRDRSAILPRQT